MNDYESLNHATWECKYHVGFIPKYCKAPYSSLRRHWGSAFASSQITRSVKSGKGI